ncbi:hypothetical protein HXY32_08140 [Candidatus Bathyarchaeota archaeon]|nr:hypothetical protein [Candidatus Bathyarchaeota archaeon]
MSVETKIPKAAIKPLVEYCQKLSGEIGKPATHIFKEFLELMRKYADYFFGRPWPEKLDKRFDPSNADSSFIKSSKNYNEECERFTVVCLRRNMSLEGFDADGFNEDFGFYGKKACWDCVVPDAMWLREEIKRIEEAITKIEEGMKAQEPSYVISSMYAMYRRPDVVRRNKMNYVELRLYEEEGGAEGKVCEVRNKYRCPYGEETNELIECGRIAKFVWRQIEWYDLHWNTSETFRPAASEIKWYHYGEPSIIDVTSYEDVLKAVEDGRLERIIEERVKYEKEHKG